MNLEGKNRIKIQEYAKELLKCTDKSKSVLSVKKNKINYFCVSKNQLAFQLKIVY